MVWLFMTIISYLPLIALVGVAISAVFYVKAFHRSKAERQKTAEEHLLKHDGKRVLEWNLPRTPGEGDSEFGELIVVLPKKIGEGAKFYAYGCIIDDKRVSYMDLNDIVVQRDTRTSFTGLKRSLQNCGKLWLYRNSGSTIGLNTLIYQYEDETALAIKSGLGY